MTSVEQEELATETRRFLEISAATLETRGSLATAREISQQPRAWRKAFAAVEDARSEIDAWLTEKLAMPGVRVYFLGAGTSAFIGDTIAAWLSAKVPAGNPISYRSVPTTDLVADPAQFLSEDRPTIMVSFARSGDSPESVASVELGDTLLTDCYHLVVTCNEDGRLARYAEAATDAYCLLMPSETNDRGFAMTSSFSSMLVSSIAVFDPDAPQLERAAIHADRIIREFSAPIAEMAAEPFDRLVVLGAGTFKGAAREAALKCLELGAGKVAVMADTPLGFRHGPKIIISNKTVVVVMRSANSYTARYDDDLLAELRSDDHAAHVVELSPRALFDEDDAELSDIWLSLLYIVYCQILAFQKSFSLGVTVDFPCPTGEVNRVVQGVLIHPYPGVPD